ncbi:MAG: hypothetical protein WAV00_02270 [Nocardioides sp.]
MRIALYGNVLEIPELPATRETVEHLRDVAGLFRRAADALSGLLQAGELA